MSMCHSKIKEFLAEHGTRYRTFNGRLQAEDLFSIHRNGRVCFGRRWVDVAGWTTAKLFTWMGY